MIPKASNNHLPRQLLSRIKPRSILILRLKLLHLALNILLVFITIKPNTLILLIYISPAKSFKKVQFIRRKIKICLPLWKIRNHRNCFRSILFENLCVFITGFDKTSHLNAISPVIQPQFSNNPKCVSSSEIRATHSFCLRCQAQRPFTQFFCWLWGRESPSSVQIA